MSNLKNNFPRVVNDQMETALIYTARYVVDNFNNKILPILRKYSICNDDVIRQIMKAETREAIWLAAIKTNPKMMDFLESVANASEEDFWKPLRHYTCKARTPREPGFVFGEMPLAGHPQWLKDKVAKAIIVKDCKVSYSPAILEDEAVFQPTDKQIKLAQLVTDFCDQLKAMGVKCYGEDIFKSRTNKYLEPDIPMMLYKRLGRE